LAALPTAAPGEPNLESRNRAAQSTTIVVDVRAPIRPVPDGLLGAHHRFGKNGMGMWQVAEDRPAPAAVQALRRSHVSVIRYPGGTIGNLFRWERAIGDRHRCQVDGRSSAGTFHPVIGGRGFGVDEHMRLVAAAGAQSTLMVQSITNTPRDAANWVEYMNAPAGVPGNPNGGVDWADRRADNGHPAPYDVQRWEIGNEQRHNDQRYWMSTNRSQALRQYIEGGHADIEGEALGKRCRHPAGGIPSDGRPGQVFDILYPPVVPHRTLVTVDGSAWESVDSLATAGPTDRVYVLSAADGTVTFGDGVHGAIPPSGAIVRADYRSLHAGVFAFIRAMRAVDPSIQACTSWGALDWFDAVGDRRYDCFSAHPYTDFRVDPEEDWDTAREGHDWMMVGTAAERAGVARMKSELPGGTAMPLTEFGVIFGDTQTWPQWMRSMSMALYMSSQWNDWLRMGIDYSTGSTLVAEGGHGEFGPAPEFTANPSAVARRAVWPMFESGGTVVRTAVHGNPLRSPGHGGDPYRGLSIAATKAANGDAYIMVVNRLPLRQQSIAADVRLDGYRGAQRMFVRAVTSASFRSTDTAGEAPAVVFDRSQRPIDGNRFSYRFPPHSITLLRITDG
jgi:alpha-N-arabinofuranosidase